MTHKKKKLNLDPCGECFMNRSFTSSVAGSSVDDAPGTNSYARIKQATDRIAEVTNSYFSAELPVIASTTSRSQSSQDQVEPEPQHLPFYNVEESKAQVAELLDQLKTEQRTRAMTSLSAWFTEQAAKVEAEVVKLKTKEEECVSLGKSMDNTSRQLDREVRKRGEWSLAIMEKFFATVHDLTDQGRTIAAKRRFLKQRKKELPTPSVVYGRRVALEASVAELQAILDSKKKEVEDSEKLQEMSEKSPDDIKEVVESQERDLQEQGEVTSRNRLLAEHLRQALDAFSAGHEPDDPVVAQLLKDRVEQLRTTEMEPELQTRKAELEKKLVPPEEQEVVNLRAECEQLRDRLRRLQDLLVSARETQEQEESFAQWESGAKANPAAVLSRLQSQLEGAKGDEGAISERLQGAENRIANAGKTLQELETAKLLFLQLLEESEIGHNWERVESRRHTRGDLLRVPPAMSRTTSQESSVSSAESVELGAAALMSAEELREAIEGNEQELHRVYGPAFRGELKDHAGAQTTTDGDVAQQISQFVAAQNSLEAVVRSLHGLREQLNRGAHDDIRNEFAGLVAQADKAMGIAGRAIGISPTERKRRASVMADAFQSRGGAGVGERRGSVGAVARTSEAAPSKPLKSNDVDKAIEVLNIQEENDELIQRIGSLEQRVDELRDTRAPQVEGDMSKWRGGVVSTEGSSEMVELRRELRRKHREILDLRKRWWIERQDHKMVVRRALISDKLHHAVTSPDAQLFRRIRRTATGLQTARE
mmetsp:Transcript_84496/g.225798  ORF Transcript_84496/g.225798 Transcript_84496/m.225798 type:complete len:766 (+) Transcript_84496:19-2316(+)